MPTTPHPATPPIPDVTDDLGRRLRALLGFVQAVAHTRGYDDLMTVMAREGLDALDASGVSLSIWERDRGRVRTIVNHGEGNEDRLDLPTEEVYLLAQEEATRRLLTEGVGYTLSLDDVDGDPGVRAVLDELGKQSCLAVPVVAEGRVWGELFATRTASQPPFVAADLDFATIVALQVGAGVAQAETLLRVERLAYTDELTDLANRRAFEDALDQALDACSSNGVSVGLIVADVNGLKKINDRDGHPAGDVALQSFAGQLSVAVTHYPSTLAARLGGDEFCVLTTGMDPDSVIELATDICHRAARVLEESVACGVAITDDLPSMEMTPASLLRAADVAQYRAKRAKLARPVVSGRVHPDIDVVEGLGDDTERRKFRGRGKYPPAPAVDAVLVELEDVADRAWQERMEVVGRVLTTMLDAAAWVVSRADMQNGTLTTVSTSVVRVATDDDWLVGAEFALNDYPVTFAALSGRGITIDIDDPRADPSEVKQLVRTGLSELLMCGGSDPSGTGWLLEVCGDDFSAPARPYASVIAAGVALALRW